MKYNADEKYKGTTDSDILKKSAEFVKEVLDKERKDKENVDRSK